jgi:hypothetical protein
LSNVSSVGPVAEAVATSEASVTTLCWRRWTRSTRGCLRDQRREDLFLSALAHYVEALGGRLEIRAVFGDDTILVRRTPGE